MNQFEIMVVEDEMITALYIEEILGELGYKLCKGADNALQAIANATKYMPDLILMDIKLKGAEDGIYAAKTIYEQLKIPIIFITSYSDEETLSRANLAHPYGYLLKPFDKDDLRTTLQIARYRKERDDSSSNDNNKNENPTGNHQEVPLSNSGKVVSHFLSRVDPFRILPQNQIDYLSATASIKKVRSGTIMIHENNSDVPHFVVVDGRISCIKFSSNGKELVVSTLGPGDAYALFLALNNEPFPFTVRAERDSQIICIDPKILNEVCSRHPEMYKEISELVIERVNEADEFSRQIAHEKVEVRIAAVLNSLLGKFGKFSVETQRYTIGLTRLELANLVGTTPETAIRVTKAMEAEHILALGTPGIIHVIQRDLLEKKALLL